MPPPGGRGTRSGSTLEASIEAALANNGYGRQKQQSIGTKPGGGRHRVDLVVTRPNGSKFLASLKWQQVGGTAEEKVPFEVIKLLHSLRESAGLYDKAYIILGGDGWSDLQEFYLGPEFRTYLRESDKVEILLLNEAIRRANRQEL